MARNLIKVGYSVVLYNRSHPVVRSLVKECKLYRGNAIAARDATELAEVDIPFFMVANDEALQSVVVESGLLDAMGEHRRRREEAGISRSACSTYPLPKAVHVSCATLSVGLARDQIERSEAAGVGFVAMPVMGRPAAAAAAQLHLLYAGSELVREYLEGLELLVPVLGQSLRYFGPEPEKAAVMEITFNFMLSSAMEALSEGAALVQKYGIEPSAFTSLTAETLFTCPAYRNYGGIIANRQLKLAGATLRGVGLNVCTLALAAGEGADVPLPFASVIRDKCVQGIAAGMGEWDWSAMAVVAEQQAGIRKHEAEREEKRETAASTPSK